MKSGAMGVQPFDDRDGLIWFNGEMVDWRDARVHVLTHALHYGSAVFEGERSYGGEIFKLTEHSERLLKSADILGYEVPWSVEQIDQACRDVIYANGITDGYVRPIAWRGSEMMAVSAQATRIHLAIAAWAWGSYFDKNAHRRGIRMKTAPWRRPAPETAPTQAKAAGLYMICTMSKHHVEAEGFHDALMLDWRGQIAESTGANIFLVMEDQRLHTPTPDCFLDGITRRTIMNLARAGGIEVVERPIWPTELKNAREVFLTGTAAEVTPVGQVDDFTFVPGAITEFMVNEYKSLTHSVKSREKAAV